jgi:type VI secretion system protein ImpH
MSAEPTKSGDVFGLLRDLERAAPGKPRIGRSLRAADDVARFAQAPHLDFAAASLEHDGKLDAPGPAHLRVFFMGLLGPMGPMPLQLSELAIYERKYAKERPYGAFLDVLSNRMIQLFFRAWADSEPVSQLDRPGEDLFQHYVGALGGLADASPHDELDRVHLAMLGFAGQTAGRRSPAAICDAASELLGIPIEIVEFVGVWRKLDPADATRLGGAGGGLGQGATAGTSIYTVQDTCLVRLKFKTLADFEAHLPDAAGFALVARVLAALLPAHLDWRVEYQLERSAAPAAKLGAGAKLGWTGWMGNQGEGPPRRDLRLSVPAATHSF